VGACLPPTGAEGLTFVGALAHQALRATRGAFNPLAREERQLFEALSSGEHHIRGFTNRDLREKLIESQVLESAAQTVQQFSGKVSRLSHRLHLYGLIAKVCLGPDAGESQSRGCGCSAVRCV
jgi:hypothetical protein